MQKEVVRRTQELIQKETDRAAAQARAGEAQKRQREVEEAYQKLEEAQDQLIQSEKLASLGRWVAAVVHELNNPLMTIQGYADLVKDNLRDGESLKHLDIISRESERCHKVVRDLLVFARRDKPKFESVSCRLLLDQILETMQLELEKSGIEVVRRFPEACPAIQGDPDQLTRVFANLLTNACYALKQKPAPRRLSVSILVSEKSMQIFFTDNGSGISREDLSRLFEPFFTTKPAGQGTGLGLSLCYGTLEEHGGKIRVQSEEGKGTTFLIELPLENPKAAEAKPRPAKKIMVVDDDPKMIEFISNLLHSWGYEAILAQSGQEALEIASGHSTDVDLLISDITMPGMDGFETVRRLRERRPFARIPVVFLTGRDEEQDAVEAKRLNAQGFFRKPFHYQELRQSLGALLKT